MKFIASRWFVILSALTVGSCQDNPTPNTITPADVEAEIKVSLARLQPADRQIAEQQRFCPMMDGVRLGEMGQPFKVTVQGVSAFVCCENCLRLAQEHPDQALANIERLKQSSAAEPAPDP